MVILHIGAPKTGTTAIQAFLRQHCDRLPGLIHPPPLRASYARHMYVYARFPRLATRDAQLLSLEPGDMPAFCTMFRDSVRRSLSAPGTAVSCNELLLRLDRAAVQRIADLVGGRPRVVVYLRRHDELAVSSYLQAKKRGIARSQVFPSGPALGYRSVIETWSGVADVSVRLYERARMPGQDVVRDFLSAIGREPPGTLEAAVESNPTWGRAQVLVGGVLDRHFPFLDPAFSGSEQRARRNDLLRYLQRLPHEPVELVSRDQARAFVERFRDDDEWVRRRFFPERASLFSDDFSRYPETVAPQSPLSGDDLTAALLELWRFRQEESAQLRARITALESALARHARGRRVVGRLRRRRRWLAG